MSETYRIWKSRKIAAFLTLSLILSACAAGTEETETDEVAVDVSIETISETAGINGSAEADDRPAEERAGAVPEEENHSDAAEESVGKADGGAEEEIERILSAMPLTDRVAQLFFVTPEALTGVDTATRTGETTLAAFDRRPVGGVIYLAKNLLSDRQTKEMLGTLQEHATTRQGFPVFLGLDEEGGRVSRIGGNPGFSVPKMSSARMLAEGGVGAVRDAGHTIGVYLSDLGFNLDFAPDADVLTNPDNKVIGDRAFGSDPEEVAVMARAFAKGLREEGIIPCYKHFPGHGGKVEDTHEGYAYSYKTLAELRESDLVPFADACGHGAEMIMAAHISLPAVTGSDVPASLSHGLITDVLRGELEYDGIVITDALGMGAVSDHYGAGEAAVLALQAGCDMLLMASDFDVSYQSVLDAVGTGILTEKRIDESVRRILRVKLSIAQANEAEKAEKDMEDGVSAEEKFSPGELFGAQNIAGAGAEKPVVIDAEH